MAADPVEYVGICDVCGKEADARVEVPPRGQQLWPDLKGGKPVECWWLMIKCK